MQEYLFIIPEQATPSKGIARKNDYLHVLLARHMNVWALNASSLNKQRAQINCTLNHKPWLWESLDWFGMAHISAHTITSRGTNVGYFPQHHHLHPSWWSLLVHRHRLGELHHLLPLYNDQHQHQVQFSVLSSGQLSQPSFQTQLVVPSSVTAPPKMAYSSGVRLVGQSLLSACELFRHWTDFQSLFL